ncbi:MAG: glycosyltransferase family 4 protein, partial [bacterium]|nr:glycosyltransferase family 4 protein [bacterium]
WPFIGGIAPVLRWRRRASKRRLVVHYHMDLIAGGWKGMLFRWYARWTLPRVLRFADRIVVSSRDYADHGALAPFVAKLGDRLVEIPFGVDTERFAPDGNQGLRIKNHGDCAILLVGGLDRAHAFKGVPILLDAVARIPDVRLRVVGNGDLQPHYERRAQALGISDRVEFLGSVSDTDLPGVYRRSDILVLPSTARSEAFGIVLLEAMASGIPVIASDLPGVRTVVVDGQTGLLAPPGDATALEGSLVGLTGNSERARQMGAAARRRAEERYAWDRVMDAWEQCYRCV